MLPLRRSLSERFWRCYANMALKELRSLFKAGWVQALKNPLICQTGPKTSAKSGWSCSIWEKRCINGPSQSSRMVGSRS